MASSTDVDKDGPPPAKRRRISKERSTEYLDLRRDTVHPEQQPQLDRLLNVLHKRQKIVVVAGAGISVSAGIPDFRSAQGIFRSLKEEYNLKGSGKELFDASVYKDDNSTSSFHDMVSTMSRLTKDAKPTAFHHMLATIAQEDRLLRLYSQNVDGIDTSLDPLKTCVPLSKSQDDGKWPRTVQLHGGLDKMVCSKCHELANLDPELFTGPIAPLCPRCEEINDIRTNHEGKRSHGIGRLRPRMVLYNEHNPDDEAIGAVTKEDLRKRPDAVIVVGTTLKVPGVRRIVREMCATVRDRRGGVAIWINNDPPPTGKDLEDCWDIVIQGPSDKVAKHAAMRKWDDPVLSESFSEVSEEDARKVAKKTLSVALSPRCAIKHAVKEPLPSDQHKNNSFRPPLPTETPRKALDHGPEDWSPIVSRSSYILPSIEDGSFDGDSIAVISPRSVPVAGLLTPSKSRNNSPAKKEIANKKKMTSMTEKLKDGTNKKQTTTKTMKTAKKAAPVKATKKSNVKYVKPALGQKKTQVKAKAQPKGNLTKSFKSSKASKLVGKTDKNDLPSPNMSPSKLRQVSNASSEPMHPLSPLDPRINGSSVSLSNDLEKDGASFDKLPYSENQRRNSKSRMSVSSIIN